jgi:RNA polymerase sigma-70 factor (ECF subfamily)
MPLADVEGLAIAAGERAWMHFEDFFRAEHARVYRAVLLATGSKEASEDAVQEAFERAYMRWRRLSKHEWAGGWVMTTALNWAKRSLRHRSVDPPEKAVGSPAGPERSDVTAALKDLPPRQAQAVLLFYLGDLPIGAVATLMGISEGTVKAHLAQGREALRGLLGAEYV